MSVLVVGRGTFVCFISELHMSNRKRSDPPPNTCPLTRKCKMEKKDNQKYKTIMIK